MKTVRRILLITLLCTRPAIGIEARDDAQLRGVLERLDVGVAPAALPRAPIPGFLEITRGTQVLYVSIDGSMLIDGDVLSIVTERNLTEARRASLRLDMLAAIPPQDRLLLQGTGEARQRIVVFTDINCPYCQQLHRQHPALLSRGIDIEYLFYPRAGQDSAAWSAAVAVWCAPDRLRALDAALAGKLPVDATCDNPVAAHYELARRLDLKGTPAIITPDGTVHYGMTSVEDIVQDVHNPRY